MDFSLAAFAPAASALPDGPRVFDRSQCPGGKLASGLTETSCGALELYEGEVSAVELHVWNHLELVQVIHRSTFLDNKVFIVSI
jgi:hypothetical protein